MPAKKINRPGTNFSACPSNDQLRKEYYRLLAEFTKQEEDFQLASALSDRYFKKLKNAKDRIEKQKKENETLQRENQSLQEKLLSGDLNHPEAFKEIITADPKMKAVFQYLEAIARSSEPLLITGETGTGKELIARAVHRLSRPGKPFLAVNVAGLDDQMFTDTLFGHVAGAFTDARKSRAGLVEEAASGTLLLNEIGDLPLSSQVKLLRLLEEREFFPLGSDTSKSSRARILCDTNVNLEEAVKDGRFRKDLLYRLCVHHIRIPPLRERISDLPLLVTHFLSTAAKDMEKKKPEVPVSFIRSMQSYSFPGNIRELRSIIYDMVGGGSSSGRISGFKYDPGESSQNGESSTVPADPFPFPASLPGLKQMRVLLIKEALQRCGGNQSRAAALLGITRQSLNKYLKNQEQ